MVGMSSYDDSLHPRGQAANAGQYRAKSNDAPAIVLDFEDDGEDILVSAGREGALAAMRGEDKPTPEVIFEQLVGRAPEPDDTDQVAEFDEQFAIAYDLASPSDRQIDVDNLLSEYASARAEKIARVNVNDGDDDAYEAYEDAVMDHVDDMVEALQRYRAKEKAELEAVARPATDIAVAVVKRHAALDATHLTGQNAVTIAAAAVKADRAARAGTPTEESKPASENTDLDPQPWRSDASGMRYAQKPRDGHGPYRFLPRVGYAAKRSDYR